MGSYEKSRTQEFSLTSQLELGLLDENEIVEKAEVRKIGRGKSGVKLNGKITYDDARNIVNNFSCSGLYLVGLAERYVDRRQLPKVNDSRRLSASEYSRYRHFGHVVLGVAKGMVKQREG